MKVAIFIYSMAAGGAERVASRLSDLWARRGWDVTVLTSVPTGSDFYEMDPKVARVGMDTASASRNAVTGLLANLTRVAIMRRQLKELRPDVAVAMMLTSNVLLAMAGAGITGIRLIGSEHTYPARRTGGRSWAFLRRLTYRRLSAVVSVSEEGGRWLQKHTPARIVKVIPNIATWPIPKVAPNLPLGSHGQRGRRMLLAVGRLHQVKGFDFLVEQFSSIAERHPTWNLIILGEGSCRSELEAQVGQLHLRQRVFLPGRAGNVGDWYERADLYVLSSRFEGFPNTLVEAMAYGLPAVSVDCQTGPRDIIRDGVDGVLVARDEKNGLAKALDRLMGDAGLRARLASRAVEVRKRYSEDRVLDLWDQLLAEVDRRTDTRT